MHKASVCIQTVKSRTRTLHRVYFRSGHIKGTISNVCSQCYKLVPSCTSTVVLHVRSLSSWPATTCTTSTLLQHQAFTQRTPPAIGPPLVSGFDQVSKHASLIPKPQVWLEDKWLHWPIRMLETTWSTSESLYHWSTIQVDVTIQVRAHGCWIVPLRLRDTAVYSTSP